MITLNLKKKRKVKMKRLLTTAAVLAFTTTSAFAFDVGMGFDRETKYKNDKGTSTNYNYVFIENKWKKLGGVKTKFTHYKNMETDVTKHNELKISKDFKFSIAGDTNDSFKITPQFKRRWDGQGGLGDKKQDNFVVEFKYSF